ncbi:hypothetical protein GCM10011402_18580 [Paracoccus acridae]|uniref:Alpha/beta hydrolase n=1 Tax=Paracoccus acridae TaxID=1795310 RepID=A0ABQ1VJ16_9RHOB|nr:hypothetical protein [Paracoccus acridae]GGF66574.1 hypothetical protein GCM10011402_18580 [Paracoccus acridae]
MPQSRTLCRHDDYLITLHQPDRVSAHTVVITFGGMPSVLAEKGFGTSFCLSQGWTTIYVAQRALSQYQGLDQTSFQAAVGPAVEGRKVVCYGSSLGGYAALYFGGAINARIIAAAPKLPAWPPIASPGLAIPLTHRPLHEAARSMSAPVVIFDPLVDHDRLTVEQMVKPAYPAARLVELPYFGHTLLNAIVAAGQLKGFMTALIQDDVVLPLDLPTDSNPGWQFRKGQALARSEPQVALRHFERFFDLSPSAKSLSALLNQLVATGNLADAQTLLDRAAAMADPDLVLSPQATQRAIKAGLHLQGCGAPA